ncbi:MAG: class II fumarate hydratase [Actinomycetes bacterium]
MTPPTPSDETLWGDQTRAAIANFPISGEPMPLAVIHALAQLKAAAARVNADLGVIDQGVGEAIALAADEVAAGGHDGQFPVDVFQTGSGTSTNMNVNEVIASLAARRVGRDVHPNDDVNASQSSNDTVPSAIHMATASAVSHSLVPALWHLHSALESQSLHHENTVKPGRTHLMDAVPVTLGQELGGYAAQVAYAVERVESTLPRVLELPLGGTATGTGLNAPVGFADAVIEALSADCGLEFRRARNPFEAQGARDALVELSGQLRTYAVGLTKVCNDLRWMSSGPSAGLSEITLPPLQAGSSIMPGKVNPVIPEAALMVCAQVMGNDTAIAVAGSQGAFELNAMLPVIARNLLQSVALLAAASTVLADKAVSGLSVDAAALRLSAERSPAVATALNGYLGYDETARIVKQALASGRSIRDVVVARGHLESGLVTEQQLDEALDALRLARGV